MNDDRLAEIKQLAEGANTRDIERWQPAHEELMKTLRDPTVVLGLVAEIERLRAQVGRMTATASLRDRDIIELRAALEAQKR